jgi:hypothetical protein
MHRSSGKTQYAAYALVAQEFGFKDEDSVRRIIKVCRIKGVRDRRYDPAFWAAAPAILQNRMGRIERRPGPLLCPYCGADFAKLEAATPRRRGPGRPRQQIDDSVGAAATVAAWVAWPLDNEHVRDWQRHTARLVEGADPTLDLPASW